MNRQTLLVGVLGTILVVALFWFFLWSPKDAELEEVNQQIAAAEQQQIQLQAELRRLEGIRDEAPEKQAQLAAAESVVPREAALPSALRQLQLAADDSGVTLMSVAPTRPESVEDLDPHIVAMALNVQLEGGYFQVVDFLRRIEDPSITPRGIVWQSLTAATTPEDYPVLTVALTGEMFAVLPVPPGEQPGASTGGTQTETQTGTETTTGEGS